MLIRNYLLLSAIFLFISAANAHEYVNGRMPETLNIGIMAEPQTHNSELIKKNTFHNINIDYVKNISNAIGRKAVLKSYPDINSMLTALDTREIDGAVTCNKTISDTENYLLSEPLFKSNVAVWYRNESHKQSPVNTLSWSCVKGSGYCEKLLKLGALSVHQGETLSDTLDWTTSGKANAVVSTYVSIIEYLDNSDLINGTIDIPTWLESEEIRFITSKENQSLVNKINQVLQWEAEGKNIRPIASTNPYHISDKLMQLYLNRHNKNEPITFSTSADAYPFFALDENHQAEGVLADFFTLLNTRTGLKFEYVKPEKLPSGNFAGYSADLVPVAYTSFKPSVNWPVSDPFMTTRYISIESAQDITPETNEIGILMNINKQGIIHLEPWESNTIQKYGDLKSLLNDIRNGHLKMGYIANDIAYTLVAQGLSDEFLLNHQKPHEVSIAFAITNEDPLLAELLNSLFKTIDTKEIQKIIRGYRQVTLTYGYLDTYVMKIAAIICLVLAVIGTIAYFAINNLKLKIKLAELDAVNEEKEKHKLQEIIQEINSLIFIHDQNNQLVLSNCPRFNSGQCKQCQIKDSDTLLPVVNNKAETQKVLQGSIISDFHVIEGCSLNIRYAKRERKAIGSHASDSAFVLTVLHDITEQKEREIELIQAQNDAQTAVVARERFLATMSHELRTPIAGVHGLLDLLNHKLIDTELKSLIGQAQKSIHHLNQLVDEVLDYSQLEAGQLSITSVKTDLFATLEETVLAFAPQAETKGLEYLIEIEPFDHKCFFVDRKRMVQVLNNLLSNAIKFTDDGYIKTTARLQNDYVEIVISDSGIGMTEDQLNHVFKPFKQADDTITRRYGGTGLGLSIVEKLITCMHGTLNIKSAPGKGTELTVTLPAERALSSDGECEATDPQELSRLTGKVLVAEDNPLNQQVLRMQLNELNLDYVMTGNGEQALEYLRENNDIQILLTDFHMPVMDGHQLTRNLKTDSRLCELPVVGITAEDSRTASQNALETGMNEVLLKPYDISDLHQILNRYLSEKQKDLPDWLARIEASERLNISKIFIRSMKKDLSVITSKVDRATLKKALHSTKGATAAIGLNRIASAYASAEKASDKDFEMHKPKLIQILSQEIATVENWITENE